MTRVEVLQTFSDHGQHYAAGEVRLVPDEKARYFCNVGWCRSPEYPTVGVPPDVTLDVHNCAHLTGAKLNG